MIYYEKEEVVDRIASNTAILFGKYLFNVAFLFILHFALNRQKWFLFKKDN
jgi:hypothetical protein